MRRKAVDRRRRRGCVQSGGISPNSIANLVAWYKADAITALNNGDKVSSWVDSSGAGNPATNGNAANQPIYNLNQINGLPAVNFLKANNTYLTGYSNASATITLFGVFKKTGDQDTGRVIAFSTLDGLFDDVASVTYKFYASAAVAPVSTGITSTSFNVVTMSFDASANVTIYKNGAVAAAQFAASNAYSNPLTLGSAGLLNSCSDCVIAEAILYTRQLSAAEQKGVEKYLGKKYAITVN